MAGVARVREITEPGQVSGSYYWNQLDPPNRVRTKDYTRRYTETADIVGNWDNPNGFTSITTRDHRGMFLDGKYKVDETLYKEYSGCPIDGVPVNSSLPPWWGEPDGVAIHNWGWNGLGTMNPSRPHVSVPTFLGELRELPMLLRGAGDHLLRQPAHAHLAIRWGLLPLLNDLRKLLDHQKAVENRLATIRKLSEGSYVGRNAQVEELEQHDTTDEIIESILATVRAKKTTTFYRKVWTSARYHKIPFLTNALPSSPTDQLRLARRLTFGVTSAESFSTLWELTPWSWLVDWFSSYGDFIAAKNNSLGLSTSHLCIMVMDTCRVTFHDAKSDSSWCTVSGTAWWEKTYKRRYPWIESLIPPIPTIPIFDWNHWAILGSLAVLRGRSGSLGK